MSHRERLIPALSLVIATILLAVPVPPPVLAHLCIIRQGLESSGTAEEDDNYGRALAAGDFNGDGFEDLAVGATGENENISGTYHHGAVVVSYGSPVGITHEGADYLSLGAPPDALVRFGAALASGFFNDDDYEDLAVGAPEADAPGGITDAGLVGVFYGGPTGLSATPNLVLDESDAAAALEAGDRFGGALAAADFNGDGHDDLAVGGYGEDSEAGAIYYFYGSAGGLTTTGAGWMKQSTIGFSGIGGDWFGWSLAAGNLVGSIEDDLVVGTPRKEVDGRLQAGQYYIIRGSATGLLATGALAENAVTLGLDATAGAYFAYSLALGQFFDVSGSLDLAVGEPRYHTGGASDAGRVVVVEYESIPTVVPATVVLVQSDAGGQVPEENDQFGFSLAAGDWNADDYDDLAVGSPYEDFVIPAGGFLNAGGIVQIFLGSDAGPFGTDSLTYDADILNDQWGVDDYLGQAVAFGRFDDTAFANLAVGAPGKDFVFIFPADEPDRDAAGSVFIVAPWRQVQNLQSWSSVSYDCENTLVFSQKPFDKVRQASTTKAMTLLLASEWADPSHPGYDVDFTDTASVYFVPSWVADTTKIGGSLAGLRWQQKISLAGLMKAMITVSGNEAAYAIADHTTGGGHPWDGLYGTVRDFVDSMNTRASQLGMTRTHFTTPKGSNDPPDLPAVEEGAHTTAFDFAILARAVMENELAASIVGRETWWIPSQKLIAPAEYKWFSDRYDNGFLTSVRNRVGDVGAGVKGGSTPEARKTGLFAAAADSFSFGPAIVTSFRSASGTTMHDQAKELLLLALGECLAPPDIALPPAPPPSDPLIFVLPAIPADDDSGWGGVLSLDDNAPDSMDVSLLAHTLVTDSAMVDIDVSRFTSVRLAGSPAGGGTGVTLTYLHGGPGGPSSFDSHGGLVVLNRGHGSASLTITHTGSSVPEGVVLLPGEAWTSPSYEEAGMTAYDFRIDNSSPDTVDLDVAMLRFHTVNSLHAEGSGHTLGTIALESDDAAEVWTDVLVFSLESPDTVPGNRVTLTMQATGVDPTDVDDLDPPGETGHTTILAAGTFMAYPNPFNPQATVSFVLGEPAPVTLVLFDVHGRRVRALLVDEIRGPGRHTVQWNGRDSRGRELASGVYFARLEAGPEREFTRLVLLK